VLDAATLPVVLILLALSVTPPMRFEPLAVIAPHPSVPMPDTLPVDPNVIVFRVVTPDIAPLLIITPLIVFVAVGAVIAPHPTVPIPDTLPVDPIVIVFRVVTPETAPLFKVTPPTELEPVAKVVMVPFDATILLNSNLTPPI